MVAEPRRFGPTVHVFKFIRDPREEITVLMELLMSINVPSIRTSYLSLSAMDMSKGQQPKLQRGTQSSPSLPAIKDFKL